MGKEFLLVIDLGTSSCVVSLFDLYGQVVRKWQAELKTNFTSDGYAEQDAQKWWQLVCRGINTLVEETGTRPSQIVGIGVDGTSWVCLPIDRRGKPLHPAMLWLDRRAGEQARWMRSEIGEEKLLKLNGNPVDPAYIVPKMLWLKEQEPDVYQSAVKFLQSNSYLVYKLTGEYSQDYSQGYGFHFFDIEHARWNESVASELGISLDLMAPLFQSHEIVGTVTRQAALETGLVEGIPVVAGGLDAACCTLGAGVIHPGQAQEQGGQAGGMSIQLDHALIHEKLILSCHVLPGQWLLQGGTVGGGGVLRWFNEHFGVYEQQLGKERGRSPFELMSEVAGKIRPGSEGLLFLPYMAGERSPIWDSDAKGVFFGLSYEKTRGHLIRALMEGVGYSLLHNLKTAEEIDIGVDVLRSVGGAANSHIWTQIKADITGKTIKVPSSDQATSLGSAILAGVGVGAYSDFEDAVQKTVSIERVHRPNQQNTEVYQRGYKLYIELYKNLKELFPALDQI